MNSQKRSYRLFVLVLVVCLLTGCGNENYKYAPGRDTLEIYGDGTFQLLKGPDEKGLFYCPTGHCEIPNITQTWEMRDEVYFIGNYNDETNAYGILSAKENTLQLCLEDGYRKYVSKEGIESGDIILLPDFASFTPEEQSVFMQREGKQISQYPSYIPVLESFSSTAYQYDGYSLGEIKSAQFLYDGKSTNISIQDPRLFRLLNALSFSVTRGYTHIRQEPVSEYEFNTYLESDTYLLDIEFQTDEPNGQNVCRMIISANRVLVVDASDHKELHSPFQYVLKDPDKEFSDTAWQDIAAAALWGDRTYLDLLWYADLVTFDIPSGTVSPNP